MTERGDLEVARAAFDRGQWSTARARYLAANRSGALPSDDIARLGEASWWMGMIEDTLAIYVELHRERMSAGAATDAAMAAIFVGMHEALRGQSAVASGWIARARRLLAEFPTAREHAFLLMMDADGALASGDLDGAATLSGRLSRLAEEHDDPTVRATALSVEGTLVLKRGDPVAGLAILDEAMLPVIAGEVDPGWAGKLYCHMMSVCHELADVRRAREWTETTEQWCEGFDAAVTFVGVCRVHRIDLLLAGGDWTRALEQARVACDELAHIEIGVAAEANYQVAELHRLRDDVGPAEAAYARAHELGRDPQPGLALLHLRRGKAELAAVAVAAELQAVADPLRRAPLLAAAAEVAIARGDDRVAEGSVTELKEIAGRFASPGWTASACQWHGAALVAQDRPGEALPVLHEAQRRWIEVAVPYEVARVRVDLARADAALGDHEGAERELASAAREFATLGAVHALRGVESLRRRAGDGLTPREAEVIAAIGPGRTNREAADLLHISERTVARHLANVYTKTGVTTRTGAVTWARERGLV